MSPRLWYFVIIDNLIERNDMPRRYVKKEYAELSPKLHRKAITDYKASLAATDKINDALTDALAFVTAIRDGHRVLPKSCGAVLASLHKACKLCPGGYDFPRKYSPRRPKKVLDELVVE